MPLGSTKLEEATSDIKVIINIKTREAESPFIFMMVCRQDVLFSLRGQ